MNSELRVEVKCIEFMMHAHSYIFIFTWLEIFSIVFLQYLHILDGIWVCYGVVARGGGCAFILLIQGQLLIMQSEYGETLQEHMH